MKPHNHRSFTPTPPAANLPPTRRRLCLLPESHARRKVLILRTNLHLKQRSVRVFLRQRHGLDEDAEYSGEFSRRDVLITPFLAVGAGFLTSAVARADEKQPESGPTPPAAVVKAPDTNPATPAAAKVEEKKEEVISSRVYDATSIGEPMAVGKDKRKVWEKLMSARIVYLGEAEQVPIRDDRELELEIVKNLRKRCLEVERSLSLALEAFPCNLQEQLNQYIDKRSCGLFKLKVFVVSLKLTARFMLLRLVQVSSQALLLSREDPQSISTFLTNLPLLGQAHIYLFKQE